MVMGDGDDTSLNNSDSDKLIIEGFFSSEKNREFSLIFGDTIIDITSYNSPARVLMVLLIMISLVVLMIVVLSYMDMMELIH